MGKILGIVKTIKNFENFFEDWYLKYDINLTQGEMQND